MVGDWLGDAAERRAEYGWWGIVLLGTNAVSAIPELKAKLSDRTNPSDSDRALNALVLVGEEGIPVLEAAFVDPQQVSRWCILWGFSEMVRAGHTDRCLPKLVEALTNTDVSVRLAATNFVQKLAPEVFTNAPAT